MSTAKLLFKLPDEEREFMLVCKSADMSSVLWRLDQELRQKIKYMNEEVEGADAAKDYLQTLRDMIPDYVRET